MKTGRTEKLYIRPALLGAVIMAVVFSHFAVSQSISFQSEKEAVVSEAINNQPVEIKTTVEAEKPDLAAAPKKAAAMTPAAEPEADKFAARQADLKQTVIKKREAPRESRTERLRRAERLLTGI
jgi:hypothetical protein